MPSFLPPWTKSPNNPRLEQGEVHLWRFSLDRPPQEIITLKQILTEDELHRAQRLLDPQKAARFVAGRAQLRHILARYLDTDPAALRFCYGPGGKPALEQGPERGLSFNLSHSGPWALLALTKKARIGVDLEQVDPLLAFEPIARQFFSPAESAWLERFAPWRRRRAFYRLWTKKEAWLKALGWGFAKPSSSIDLEGTGRGGERWWLKNFPAGRNVLAALAVEGEISAIRCWQL